MSHSHILFCRITQPCLSPEWFLVVQDNNHLQSGVAYRTDSWQPTNMKTRLFVFQITQEQFILASQSLHLQRPGCGAVYPVGLYGWRKRCLYFFLLLLLVTMIVNLALTVWIIKVMNFSLVSKAHHQTKWRSEAVSSNKSSFETSLGWIKEQVVHEHMQQMQQWTMIKPRLCFVYFGRTKKCDDQFGNSEERHRDSL